MRDFQKGSGLKEKLFMLAGVIVGGGTMLLIIACAYISNPVVWWTGLGRLQVSSLALAA